VRLAVWALVAVDALLGASLVAHGRRHRKKLHVVIGAVLLVCGAALAGLLLLDGRDDAEPPAGPGTTAATTWSDFGS
jgi:hypothetical protein